MAVVEQRIAIIGSGLIGKAWAMVFARAGHRVRMYDVIAESVPVALAGLAKELEVQEKAGLLQGITAAQAAALVSGASSMAELLKGATYVQECVPENLDLKKKVWAEIDLHVDTSSDPILASSTSNLKCSLWSEALKHRERCLVAHPINPPHLIPAVELVPAPYTLPAIVDRARALMQQVKQAPMVLRKELDGFIVNRLQFALLGEAYRLVESGAASPHDVDLAISHGLGLRWAFMGPFQTIDLNAPNGVLDYHTRYTPAMSGVLVQQVNQSPCVSDATARLIHDAMREQVPAEQLRDRAAWRDAYLMRLALLRQDIARNGVTPAPAAPTPP